VRGGVLRREGRVVRYSFKAYGSTIFLSGIGLPQGHLFFFLHLYAVLVDWNKDNCKFL